MAGPHPREAATTTELPHRRVGCVPAVTAGQMREIDRLAIEDFGIGLDQMMELAGANLALLAGMLLNGVAGRRVTVLAGAGNNGGGGLVAARHMANRGADVHVVLAVPAAKLNSTSQDRLTTLLEMHVRCCVVPWDLADGELDTLLAQSDLLVDALLGYGADGAPRGAIGELVDHAGGSGAPVLSLDVPTGLSPDTGLVEGRALTAAATMTIALPKHGLLSGQGRTCSGKVYLADIGLPPALYARAGLVFEDPFRDGAIVGLD